MIVVDASAIVELLYGTSASRRLRDRLLEPDLTLHAPHLLDLEVAQVVRRHAMTGELSASRAQEALADLRILRLTRYPHDLFLPRIWELRHNLTAYDAVYVALAEALDALLVTCDRRLSASRGHDARVEVI